MNIFEEETFQGKILQFCIFLWKFQLELDYLDDEMNKDRLLIK